MKEAYRVFALTRCSQFPYKWNPVTRVTSERTAYNELKIDEREREREEIGIHRIPKSNQRESILSCTNEQRE